MLVRTTYIPGLLEIELSVFDDNRGFFAELWRLDVYEQAGIESDFLQDNVSVSKQGTLRGLHYQVERPQGHLITVSRGRIFDVGVDLRRESPTFGKWFGTELTESRLRQVYLPPGVAHGFCTLSESAEVLYKCTSYYDREDEGGLYWADPDVGIEWPIENPIVSDKDRNLPRLKDIAPSKLPCPLE